MKYRKGWDVSPTVAYTAVVNKKYKYLVTFYGSYQGMPYSTKIASNDNPEKTLWDSQLNDFIERIEKGLLIVLHIPKNWPVNPTANVYREGDGYHTRLNCTYKNGIKHSKVIIQVKNRHKSR